MREVGRKAAEKRCRPTSPTPSGPLQEQLRETMAGAVNLEGLGNLVPDVDRLVAPEFLELPEGMSTAIEVDPRIRVLAVGSVVEWDPPSLEFPSAPEPAEYVLESRRLSLEQANVAAAQLEQRNEIGDRLIEIRDAGRDPRHIDWWILASRPWLPSRPWLG